MPIEGSVLYSNPSFAKSFENAATKGTVHFEANYTATTNGQETWKVVDSNGIEIFGTTDCGYSNGNATKNWGFCNGNSLGTGYFRQARSGHNRIVLDINLASKVVSYTVLVSSGNNSYSTLTGTYNLPESVTDVKGLTATKQTYYSYMDNVSFYNVYDDAASEAGYTINYQLSGETVVSETGAGTVGATVNALSSIWNEGNTQKYFTADGETTSFTIAEGTNIFNVAVREAENWTYSIKAVVGGDDLLTIATPSVVEGETASYGYPQYVAKDGVLYKTTAQSSNPWWGKSFTPSANNETQSITYTAEGTTGIVYCSEAEDIDGMTVVSGGNTDIRASNRKGGYGTNVVVTTLTPGIYTIYSAAYGNAGVTFTFKAGETTVMELATEGNPKHRSSEDFIVTIETTLTVSGGNGGNSPKVIDYIIIKQQPLPTSISATIGTAGFATLYTPYALDFSGVEGLTAYTATVSDNTVTLNPVNDVPANTGVVLKGDANTYSIPVIASSETEQGDLKGSATESKAYDEDYNYYILKLNADEEAQFTKMTSGTIAAGKAYLQLDKSQNSKLRVVFADDATAIKSIATDAAENAAIYNLSGQRVNAAYKGIVIKNGKKYLNK